MATRPAREGAGSPPGKAAGDRSTAHEKEQPERSRDNPQEEQPAPRRAIAAGAAARAAMQQVSELTGRDPESVTHLERVEEEWRVGVEVVESHRIPDSTDIMAVYETRLDEEGELVSYRRTQRYHRGRTQED